VELRHLRLIVAIWEEGSLTRAAEKLCLTQSALSHQLGQLEDGLGFDVFNRVNRRLKPTEQGLRLIKRGKKILSEITRSVDYAINEDNRNRTILQILVECYSSFSWLPEVLSDFSVRFPQTEVIVESSLSHDYEYDLMNEVFDVGLVINKRLDSELEFHELTPDRLVVVISDKNPLAKHSSIGFESLKNETIITHCKQNEVDAIFEHITPPSSFKPRKIIQVTSTESIMNLVDRGIGVAVMSEWAIRNYCSGRKISLKPFEKEKCTRLWYLATKKNAARKNHLIRCFIELMKSQTNIDPVVS
jgi:LysR family transcriptional regulator, regulator for metE and metH